MPSPNQATFFVENLLTWYEENGRHNLPWRTTEATPFNILVAEFMLQQTPQVKC